MLIEEYFRNIENYITSSPLIHSYNLNKDKRSIYIGLVEGNIKFINNSILHFVEFVDSGKKIEKFKYSYHYENNSKNLIFRYDMAPHFRNIETYPHHKHMANNNVVASKEPSLEDVLYEIEKLILKPKD